MKQILAALFSVLFLTTSVAAGATAPANSASCAILVDADSGRVLYEKNPDVPRAIASITKLMTALVAISSHPDLTEVVTVTREDTRTEGSSIYLKVGERVTMETLLYGLLLESGNDAAITIARVCAGDVPTFVEWMNQWADELGMEHTRFSDPSGLADKDHYSTAADMAKLAVAVMGDETLARMVATKSITLGTRTFSNHNKLLWQYKGCIGMKTGYTDKAGRTLVSCAEREGQRLIAVTLNAPNDWRDHAALFDYGFARYPRAMLALAGREVRSLPVSGSVVPAVSVATADDVYYPVAHGERITAQIDLPQRVRAPIKKGRIAGSITFYLDGKTIGKTYLEYTATVAENVFHRRNVIERVLDFFNNPTSAAAITAFCSTNLYGSRGQAAHAVPMMREMW